MGKIDTDDDKEIVRENEGGEKTGGKVTKKQLVRLVARRSGTEGRTVNRVLDSLLVELVGQTRQNRQVIISGFGRFYQRLHKGHNAHFGNVVLPDYRTLSFSTTPPLRTFINSSDEEMANARVPGTVLRFDERFGDDGRRRPLEDEFAGWVPTGRHGKALRRMADLLADIDVMIDDPQSSQVPLVVDAWLDLPVKGGGTLRDERDAFVRDLSVDASIRSALLERAREDKDARMVVARRECRRAREDMKSVATRLGGSPDELVALDDLEAISTRPSADTVNKLLSRIESLSLGLRCELVPEETGAWLDLAVGGEETLRDKFVAFARALEASPDAETRALETARKAREARADEAGRLLERMWLRTQTYDVDESALKLR